MTEQYSQKWAIASFFDPLLYGSEFYYTETPQHVTLAGVFAIEMGSEDIQKLIEVATRSMSVFEIQSDVDEVWGEVTVSRIKYSDDLDNLYRTIQRMLIDNSAVFNEPQYLLDGFKTHVTHQRSGQLSPDEIKSISSVSLVDMFPEGVHEMRTIAAVIDLEARA